MNNNLEQLKKVDKEYFDNFAKLKITYCYLIPILEEYERRLTELEKRPTVEEAIKEADRNYRIRGINDRPM